VLGPRHRHSAPSAVLAAGTARDTRLAFPVDYTAALVTGMVQGAPAAAAELGRGRPGLHKGVRTHFIGSRAAYELQPGPEMGWDCALFTTAPPIHP